MDTSNIIDPTVVAPQDHRLEAIQPALLDLLKQMEETEHRFQHVLDGVHPDQRSNAVNLLHYMTLRNVDLRQLQDNLHIHGLSSLASSESHVRAQVHAVLNRLGVTPATGVNASDDYFEANQKRIQQTTALFGARENPDIPSIMVTFDTAMAEDVSLVKHLLHSGMNVARINCAHDDEPVWQTMIWTIQKAVKTTGIPCKIYMDLAGPKMRTVIPGKAGKKHKLNLKHHRQFILSGVDTASSEEKVIYCSESGVVEQLKVGERVLFDDGAVETVIEKMIDNKAYLRVLRISGKKPVIKEGKGINFPDSQIDIAPLTSFDLGCIPFVVDNADLVGFSFVKEPTDVQLLQEKLNERTPNPPAIILKIETQDAVNNLPHLLLQGMKYPHVGVMIARGDLAVEIGIERLSEIQDEILWICDAAHVPTIWATQVLESLNKSGFASRSEGTDAARSVMAECVMINKGTHLIEVLEALKNILGRSGGHRAKKRYLFRPLAIAHRFLNNK